MSNNSGSTDNKDEFSFQRFKEYLRGIGGLKNATTAAAIVNDVLLYFNNSAGSSTMLNNSYSKLFSRKSLEEFYDLMKTELSYKPSTIAEKFRRLRKAIDFIIYENLEDSKLAQRGLQYKELLNSWINSLSKQIKQQRHERGIMIDNEVAHTISPKEFLKSSKVKKKVSVSKENISRGLHETNDMKLITAYAAAILLYKNGQRSGVIDNLTVKEFQVRRENKLRSEIVIPCVHHKTSSTGCAKLVVKTQEIGYLLDYYFLVRSQIVPQSGLENLFFLTTNGGRYTQVYRKIKEAIKANGIETDVPTPSAFRIKVTSDSLRSGSSDVTRRKVNKHLSHSNRTAEMFYEFVNDNDAITAYHEINRLEDM